MSEVVYVGCAIIDGALVYCVGGVRCLRLDTGARVVMKGLEPAEVRMIDGFAKE